MSMNDERNIIKLRGLPWNSTAKDIIDFLKECQTMEGEKSVHLAISHRDGRPNGEAFVELASPNDVDKAFEYNKNVLGHRYIEIFNAKPEEFEMCLKRQNLVQQDTFIKLRGLPFSCKPEDIEQFFQGLEIRNGGNGIYIVYDNRGRPTGEAFVQFSNSEDTDLAMKKNREKIGQRYIEIFRSSSSECRRSTIFNNNGGGVGNGPRNGGGNLGGFNNDRGMGRGQRNTRTNFRDRPYPDTPWSGGNNNNNSGNNDAPWRNNNRGNFGGNSNFGGGNNNSFGNNDSFGGGGNNASNNNRGNFGGNSNFGGGNNSFGNNDSFGGNNNANSNNNFSSDFERNWNSGGNNSFNSFGGGNNLNKSNNGGTPFNRDTFGGGFGGGGNSFGGGNNNSMGGGNFGGGNDRFLGNNNMNNGGGGNNQYAVHLRGMPYDCGEDDVAQFFAPLKLVNVEILYNNNGRHTGEADAYFSNVADAQEAMKKHKEKMGSRYIELFAKSNDQRRGGGGPGRF